MSTASAWSASGPPEVPELPSIVDGRYRIERRLGHGGMAVVYAAWDAVRARRVALKHLQQVGDAAKRRRHVELFEREFHMLSQLAHPRIVQAYDFATGKDGTYYSMELLEGRDVQRLAPMPWRRACAMARDVCSALSLLHSRRFVHRDVSPRNVHCLPDGSAKLLDFGVIAPMGAIKFVVGTPPCSAPESLNLQSIDARTDLFALGATLYFSIVGRHAYSAARLADLPDVWRANVARMSDLVPDVPKALDALVLDLLRLEPDARPASAAEVMERLNAIDGAAASEEQRVAQAYLSTPLLVGREAELARVQRRIDRDSGERVRTIIIEGAAGVGRTRFLDASLLQATLHGSLVVRSDADDANSGDYGVARALARQLFQLAPSAARETAEPWLAELHSILPDAAQPRAPEVAPPVARPQLQQALQAWLLALSRVQPFVVAVDDLHRIDEPSASLLSLLDRAESQSQARLCLLLSVESCAEWTAEAARKSFASAYRIELGSLGRAECEKLLGSLFGNVPHVDLLAHRAEALCAGNPRDLLRLAQHFIDRGLVRYAAGAWTLPAEIDEHDLPASLAHALAARIEQLSAPAQRLAHALALCPDQQFSFAECARLSAEHDHARLLALHEQLAAAEVARRVGDHLTLSHRSWTAALRARLTPELALTLEHELASIFEQRGTEELRAAQHWFRAGRPDHALDVLVAHAKLSQEATARGTDVFLAYLRALPEGWLETFEEGLRMCAERKRPRRDEFILLGRLSGIMPMQNLFGPKHALALFARLERDSGLADWAELASEPDPRQRLMKALASAKARYDAAPEHERVNDPITSIAHLARAVIGASAGVALSLDLPYLRSWPNLAPLAPLSPAVDVVCKLIAGVDARCGGRSSQARRIYLELLELVQRPDRAGLDPSHAGYIMLGVMNGLGMLEAVSGFSSCLEWADKIAINPAYEVNAILIRLLYHTFNGDAQAADQCKRSADRVRIQNLGRAMYEGQHLIGEVQAHALSGDVTRMRHVKEELVPLAARHPHWKPVLRFADAEYYRLVGHLEKALRQLEQALELALPGMHQIWPAVASAHLLVLLDLERTSLALECAERYLEQAQRELEDVPEQLRLAHALVLAHAGRAEPAELADAVIADLEAGGFGLLQRGHAHEVRARIALIARDQAAFDRHAELCSALFSTQKNGALSAKSQRLIQDGARAFTPVSAVAATPDSRIGYSESRLELSLAHCRDEGARARVALRILLAEGGASAGCLYMLTPEGPAYAAQHGSVTPARDWLPKVQAYLAAQAEQAEHTLTVTETQLPLIRWLDAEGVEYRPVALCHNDNGTQLLTGVALLGSGGERPARAASAISRFYAALRTASHSRFGE